MTLKSYETISEKDSITKLEEAVRQLILHIGEDPDREGLIQTPRRVTNSYLDIFSGYSQSDSEVLSKQFFQKANLSEYVFLKDIKFYSMCEHHILPMVGTVDICYMPNQSIVGISKLAKVVDVFSKRLQVQEKMTNQIAQSIHTNLKPIGVAVRSKAIHFCMTMRGVRKQDSKMETYSFTGAFKSNQMLRQEFFSRLS